MSQIKISNFITIVLFLLFSFSYCKIRNLKQKSSLIIIPVDATSLNSGLVIKGNVYLGTPTQQINVLFDTGSLWLQVGNAKVPCPSKLDCDDTNRFDWTLSTTYSNITTPYNMYSSISDDKIIKPTTIQYGSTGPMYGYPSTETLTLGTNQISLKNPYNFALMEKSTNGATLGLAYGFEGNCENFSYQGPCMSLREELFKQGLIPQDMHSFYLRSDLTGSLVLGGMYPQTNYDDDLFGSCNVASSSLYWQCNPEEVGGVPVNTGISLVFDSGTSGIILPPENQNAVISQLGLSEADCTTTIQLTNCTKAPSKEFGTFTITLDGNTINLEPYVNEMYMNNDNKTFSVSFILGFGEINNTYILGAPYFSQYQFIFDKANSLVKWYPTSAMNE